MKKTVFNFVAVLLAASLFLTSCHKKEKTEPDDQSLQAMAAGDQSNVDNESNTAMDESNTAIGGSSRARIAAGGSLITNATIDSANRATGFYKITYDGLSADGRRNRTGSISIQVGTPTSPGKWQDQGNTLTLTFNDYKITRVATGKSITINGTKTITNVTGGNIAQLVAGTVSSLTHTINGTLSITFDDGTTRSWVVTKQRVITTSSVTITGTSTKDNYNGVVYSGINRNGNSFTGVIQSPLVYNISMQEITSGEFLHHGPRGELKVIYGVDNAGNITQGTPYGYKLEWTGLTGKSRTAVIQY